MNGKWVIPICIFIALGWALLRPKKPGHQPTHFYIVFDATVEERLDVMRHREAVLLEQLGALKSKDRASLYTLDRECLEVFSPDQPLPQTFRKTHRLLKSIVPPSSLPGTWPHKAWKKLAEDVSRDKRSTIVIFESDGDQDNASPEARKQTADAILALAAMNHVKLVVVVGVNKDQKDRTRRELAPLGERGCVFEKNATPGELKRLVEGVLPISSERRS